MTERAARRMRIRKKELGDKNLVGARIETARRSRGMKQKELLALLRERGYCCSAGKLSDYINGRVQSEAGMRILSAARDILRERKRELKMEN